MMIGEQTFWYFGEKSKLISMFTLLLVNPPLVGLTRQESWCMILVVGDEIVTGGMSTELSWGGGCCHWGSGPARRSVWRSGPASITACRNLPCSGNGFLTGILSVKSGFGGGGSGRSGDATTMLSSQSERERSILSSSLLVVSLEIGQSSSGCFEECVWICTCWKSNCFSMTSCWHFAWNSSLSLMIVASKSLMWRISSSFLEISSWAVITAASSSKVEYKSDCFNSSTP